MENKARIMDEASMKRSIVRMSHEILERNDTLDDVIIVGIRTRGIALANRIAAKLTAIEGVSVPVVDLDVRPYRDDISQSQGQRLPVPGLSVSGKIVILVDDVLYTGRTVRAALDAVMASGRARLVQFATLIDRGHRELPIRPDFVGKNVPTARDESVSVLLKESDGKDEVFIVKNL